ncbi:MAG: hypothetical protein DCC71_00965 [Proteobacteria bacterium]|nr:MAG: hypothetical protein DCC71_00965 [Pseudomonadota bacterium]
MLPMRRARRALPASRAARAARAVRACGWACAALLLASTACNVHRNLYLSGVPWVGVAFDVARADVRGRYLDVELHGQGTTLRAFLPASEECAAVATPETTVRFEAAGALGRLERAGAGSCTLAGIGSLEDWRGRGPRGVTESPVPRAQAEYDLVYRDADVALLRGRFPLVGELGWTGASDTIAVVPTDASCAAILERDVASMEYRPAGGNVLTLVSGDGLCRIEGLIRPLAWAGESR